MSMLFKRIKDWATTITAFRTGDVIPVDGPSGTAKMPKDDLLREVADNTLGNIHNLTNTATESDLVAGNFLAIDVPGVGGVTKKLNSLTLLQGANNDELKFGMASDNYDELDLSGVTWTDGKMLNNSGAIIDAVGYSVSSIINLSKGTYYHNQRVPYAFASSCNSYGTINYEQVYTDGLGKVASNPGSYFRICKHTGTTLRIWRANNKLQEQIDEKVNETEYKKEVNPLQISFGKYLVSGVESSAPNRALSGFLRGSFVIECNSGFYINHYSAFDENYNYVGEISEAADKSQYLVRCTFRKDDNSNFDGTEDIIKSAYVLGDFGRYYTDLPALKNPDVTFENYDYSNSDGSKGSSYVHRYASSLIKDCRSVSVHDYTEGSGFCIRKVLKYKKDGTFVLGVASSSLQQIDITDGAIYDYRFVFGTSSTSYPVTSAWNPCISIKVASNEPQKRLQLLSDDVEQSLETEVVAGYAKNVHYSYGQITGSEVLKFSGAVVDYVKDQPRPVTIDVSSYPSAVSVAVYCDPTFTTLFKTFVVEGGKALAYNLVPKREYYYTVLNSTSGIVGCGSFRTGGSRRFIKCDSTHNIRDFGGVGDVTYGRIFRGGAWGTLTADEKTEMLNVIGISAELDFRTDDESGSATESALDPSLPYYRLSPGAFASDLDTNTNIALVVKKMAEWLAEGKNLYCHCAGGCDRTGFVFFVLGALLGCSESELAKDYELSSFSIYGNRTIEDNSAPAFYAYGVQRINALTGSTLEEKVTTWLVEKGVTESEIANIKIALLKNYK